MIEAEVVIALGAPAAALELIDRTLLTCAETGEALWLAELHRMRALAEERRGRRGDAVESLRLAQRIADTQGTRLFANVGAPRPRSSAQLTNGTRRNDQRRAEARVDR